MTDPGRYRSADGTPPSGLAAAPGWRLVRRTPPSTLYGANGLRFGPDGRLFVAQTFGSQITAFEVDEGIAEIVSPTGGPIVAPDDLAFDSRGTLYATEVMNARVSARSPDGRTRVVADGLVAANGITIWRDRLFVDECRPQGRLLELEPAGGAPRVLAAGLAGPNALAVGPDDRLYFPLVHAGEVWRIPVDGGTKERVTADLSLPTAVKIDARGDVFVVESGTGEISRLNARSGAKQIVAKVDPGVDNFAFDAAGRLFVSHFFDGRVTEVPFDGAGSERLVVPGGFLGPWGLAIAPDGTVWIADGGSLATLSGDGALTRVGTLLQHGFPGFVRSVAVGASGASYVSTTAGTVAAHHPRTGHSATLAAGLAEPYDLAAAPDGSLLVTEGGAGRVLAVDPRTGNVSVVASGLRWPTGIATTTDGACIVAETGRGCVVRLEGRRPTVVADGFDDVQGIAVHGDRLFALDATARSVRSISLSTGSDDVIVTGLPVGAPPGTVPKPLAGVPDSIPGPITPFAGLTSAPDGTVWIAANGDGSLLTLERNDERKEGR